MPKLHIPGPNGGTACQRQLNNSRDNRTQHAANAVIAKSQDEYLDALSRGKACRHCGRVRGFVAPVQRTERDEESDDE